MPFVVSGSLWHYEQSEHVWQKCTLHHKQAFFCSSFVTSESMWLHTAELSKKVLYLLHQCWESSEPFNRKYAHILHAFRSTSIFLGIVFRQMLKWVSIRSACQKQVTLYLVLFTLSSLYNNAKSEYINRIHCANTLIKCLKHIFPTTLCEWKAPKCSREMMGVFSFFLSFSPITEASDGWKHLMWHDQHFFF